MPCAPDGRRPRLIQFGTTCGEHLANDTRLSVKYYSQQYSYGFPGEFFCSMGKYSSFSKAIIINFYHDTKIFYMIRLILVIFSLCILGSPGLNAQAVKIDRNKLEAINVSMSMERLMGKEVVKVIKDSTIAEVDEPTFAKLKGITFKNGTIEVKVFSRLLPNAPELARGFIGIAFRINDNNSKFEGIYVRPTNGRANSQLRRNRSIQYFSFPDYKFDRLRKEAPGEYESYADMGLNEWIKLKIMILDNQAKLFINDNKQPSLVVNDLKHGAAASGSIGLWVDVGTEGFFADVIIQQDK